MLFFALSFSFSFVFILRSEENESNRVAPCTYPVWASAMQTLYSFRKTNNLLIYFKENYSSEIKQYQTQIFKSSSDFFPHAFFEYES